MTGFWASEPVRTALVAGAVVAVVSGVAGVFTVVRGQSFAGHALGDLGTLGGSGAFLAGVNPFFGYVAVGAAVAATMELFGVQHRRGRDVATGIVLGAALGVAALLLYFDTTSTTTTGATITILFGSLFTISPGTVPVMAGLAAAAVAVVAVIYRPLLLSSLNAELAASRGVRVRAVGVTFLVLVGEVVALTAVAVGTILSTALLVGPAAAALRLARRPLTAMALAAGIGLLATWGGVALSYASHSWPPSHAGWPVSFFVVALVLALYLAAEAAAWARGRAGCSRA